VFRGVAHAVYTGAKGALAHDPVRQAQEDTHMSELQQTLRELHRELGASRQIAEEDRVLLEATLAEIQRVLERSGDAGPGADIDQESDSPGDALEGAAVRLEAGHPGLAGAVRAVVDALAKAGI
jgi:hypothetical protein